MITRTRHLVVLAVLSAAVLSGCGLIPTGPLLIDPDEIADTAENALEDAYDARYTVDCGSDGITLVEGKDVDCLATDRDTDLEYDADVEITDVDGAKYEIEVELADEANNAEEIEPEVDPSEGTGVTVPGADIAALAATALSPYIGFEPADMVCLSDDVEVFVDNVEFCGYTGEDGEIVTVQVTITSFDEATGNYEIYAEVIA